MFPYILTFIEGLLTFISPCVLPMIPIYFSYLAGTKKNGLLLNSIGFVSGFTFVFVMLGFTATWIAHLLSEYSNILRQISGIIMILFGLGFMGVFKMKFYNLGKRMNFQFEKIGFVSSILFGISFGFSGSPCLGYFLGSAVVLASNMSTVWQGTMLLITYSIGLGVPFIVSALIFERIKDTIKFINRYNKAINIGSGILLIIAGILVFTDSIKYLKYFL